jgi:hypothetical protein
VGFRVGLFGCFPLPVLGMELQALSRLGQCSTMEPHPSPRCHLNKAKVSFTVWILSFLASELVQTRERSVRLTHIPRGLSGSHKMLDQIQRWMVTGY